MNQDCIDEGYQIPYRIRRLLDRDFLIKFRDNLCHSYKIDKKDFKTIMDDFGTFRWHNAFQLTCDETNKKEIYDYGEYLEWFDSDAFDSKIAEMIVEL